MPTHSELISFTRDRDSRKTISTYHDRFVLEYDRPTSLHDGIKFILEMRAAELNFATFDDDFELI